MKNACRPNPIKKILLVDDDSNFRKVLQYFLIEMGFEVDGVEDGKAALEQCLALNYSLIIADANTPMMGILRFVSEIRRQRPEVPVLVISAFSSETSEAQAYRSGAIEFLEKPCDLVLLREAVKRFIA